MFITGPRSGHQRWCNIATGYMHICKFVVRYIVTGCIFCAPSALRQVRFSTPSGTPPPPVHMKVECPPPPPGLVTGNQIRNVRKNTLCKCKQHYCVVTLQFWKKKKKKKKTFSLVDFYVQKRPWCITLEVCNILFWHSTQFNRLAHISCKAIMTNNVSMENQITKLSKWYIAWWIQTHKQIHIIDQSRIAFHFLKGVVRFSWKFPFARCLTGTRFLQADTMLNCMPCSSATFNIAHH